MHWIAFADKDKRVFYDRVVVKCVMCYSNIVNDILIKSEHIRLQCKHCILAILNQH